MTVPLTIQRVICRRAVFVLLTMLACTRGMLAAASTTTQPFAARGEAVVKLVREELYDSKLAEAWAAKHRDYAAEAADEASFARITRDALAELGLSHTGYYTRDDLEYWSLRAIFDRGPARGRARWSDHPESIGVDVTPGGFVRVVFAVGPAYQAGLKRGDRILLAGGEPFHPVRSFRGKAGRLVKLRVRRAAGGEPFEANVIPRHTDLRAQWLEHQTGGTRIIQRAGRKFAYVPLFCGAGETYEQALRDAIAGPLGEADAIILDFRYGWGGLSPSFVTIFDPAVPRLVQRRRDHGPDVLRQSFRGPVYILTGPGTRSGKELVCHAMKASGRATLVGEPTAGAVLGGQPFQLDDGALLLLPVADVEIDGERLEGRPVVPDLAVADAIEFADGADPQLTAALELAERQLIESEERRD